MICEDLRELELYERAASEVRETMRILILPGREPPSASSDPAPLPVIPSVSDSQLLPTDPVAIVYPNKTLESVPTTAVIGGLPTEERKEQRSEDARYCARNLAGHVVLSQLDVVLARLGSPVLIDKLTELESVARTQINPQLRKDVLDKFRKESVPSLKPADRAIDGRYWLSRLADAALKPAVDDSLPVIDYFPIPAEKLPEQEQLAYKKTRKYDASLRPSAAKVSTIFNIFVNVEFTKTDPPTIASNPLIGPSEFVAKYQQAIINADDLLTFQPTRLFVPTLSFHGKGENTKLFVSILSQERLEFAVVDNCFAPDSFPTVSALLQLFRSVSLYQLGYNPLFTYNFSSPPSNFSVGDAVPASVVLPGARGPVIVSLSGLRLSQLRSTPFERSTLVLEGELVEQSSDDKGPTPTVIKMSFVAEARLWRERLIVDALYAADVQPAPAYAPKLLGAFAAHGSPPLGLPSEILPAGKRKRSPSVLEHLPAMVHRHLEIMAFVSPRNARKLKDISSAAEFLTAAEQLFQAILDAFCRRILHRDISVNNILVANSQLVMIDWEIGRRFQESWLATRRGTLTGTLDTMSVASLSNEGPLPHDDIESAVYVLLKVLTQTFVPPVNQQREWAETLKEEYCWDRPDVEPRMLRNLRAAMWRNNPYDISLVNRTQEMFRLSGHETRAQLVHALLSLPLPARRIEIGSDYDIVLSSLEDLVEQAVAAVHSVDASSLFGSSAGGVVAPG